MLWSKGQTTRLEARTLFNLFTLRRSSSFKNKLKAAGLANDLNERLLASNKDSLAIATKQLAASEKANSLTLDLLVSNEEAKVQDEKNANSMNAATQELASSTKWLKWATWALVLFTAVQAIIA